MAPQDDRTFGVGNRVVSGPHVGWVIRDGASVTVLTTRRMVTLPPNAPMRALMPREEAQRVVDALCREGEGEGLVPGEEDRDSLFAELAFSLGISERALRAAVKRRDASLALPEPPWRFSGHEYLGAFRVEGGLIIADRCYVDRKEPLLALRTPALRGAWHAYVRTDPSFVARTVGLLVVHGDHISAAKDAGRELGSFGVDAGCAVVVDARVLEDSALVRALTESSGWEEGLIGDAGCFSFTHMGDGIYRARVIEREGAVIAVRVNLSYDAVYDYHEPPPPERYTKALEGALSEAGPAKPYAPSETFAAGDRVSHKKFGEGLVKAVIGPDKVEIAFPEGVKTLVQGKR